VGDGDRQARLLERDLRSCAAGPEYRHLVASQLSEARPPYGFRKSTPMTCGSPMCIGAPWNIGKREVISTARCASLGVRLRYHSHLCASFVIILKVLQHRPTAIDRKIYARDLACDVAGQKQTGICDILVGRYPSQGIISGMALRGFLLTDPKSLCHFGHYLAAEPRAVHHTRRDAIHIDVVRADLKRKGLRDAAQSPLEAE